MSRPNSRRAVGLPAAIILGALVAFPLGVVASHQFADVPDENPYHNDIDALADSGVTSGCGGGNFCPSAFVTREQMAAFMNRLGALAAGKTPVVNAKTAQDADKLDGLDSTAFTQHGSIIEAIWGPVMPSQLYPPSNIYAVGGLALITKGSAGDVEVGIPLRVPLSIGGVLYGWSYLQVCFAASASVTLSEVILTNHLGDGSYQTVASDLTDHSLASAGCFSLDADAYPDGIYTSEHAMGIKLFLTYAGSASAKLTQVTVIWRPR